ncbi:hypothetical protein Zmor_019410 [Zophobas morio]|uniref:Uncharacterized protein n=1 Tax=Zophobas morio TaxID=2755281 RepID=A0AA38I1K6_9CUCU|nr:hypothetical protein Zmor_019410 [Zophobas morio]
MKALVKILSVILLVNIILGVVNAIPVDENYETEALIRRLRPKRGEKTCHILNRSGKPITESQCDLVCWEQSYEVGRLAQIKVCHWFNMKVLVTFLSVILLFNIILGAVSAIPIDEHYETYALVRKLRPKREEKTCHILNKSGKPITESECDLVCWSQEFQVGRCRGNACYCSNK